MSLVQFRTIFTSQQHSYGPASPWANEVAAKQEYSHRTHITIMLEISRPMLFSLSMDLRFLVCEHVSLRTRVYSGRTRLHSQIRKAHNLSDRFNILEKNLRPHRQIPTDVIAGGSPVEDISPLSHTMGVEAASQATEMEVLNKGGSKSILRPKPRTLKGVLIPVKPPPPASDGTPRNSCEPV
jgi:hypothetical protein